MHISGKVPKDNRKALERDTPSPEPCKFNFNDYLQIIFMTMKTAHPFLGEIR
jgi:hypothetical protein